MSLRKTLVAAGLGVIAGYLIKQQLDECRQTSPEKALEIAKETFKKQGPISGSWIYMRPEEVEKNGLSYTAYRGGITRNIDGENKQYEFYTDKETGAVIDAMQTD